MLTFDKIKIVTSIDYIEITDEDAFRRKEQCGELLSLHYEMDFPSKLYIKVDFEDKELVIEFTGKMVGTSYPKMISKETITDCFQNINKIGICILNIDGILHNSTVVSCDVTRDVQCKDIPRLTKFLNANIRNRKKYICRAKTNGNYVIEKNVDSPMYKRRLTIYDKFKEMNLVRNKRFSELFNIPDEEFKDKCRFELNLGNKAQIRSALKIDNNDLMTVLSSSADPITEFLDEVIVETSEKRIAAPASKKEYEASLVLQDCDYDLNAVEAKLRSLSSNFHPQRDMSIYREILSRGVTDDGYTKERILDLVKGVSD